MTPDGVYEPTREDLQWQLHYAIEEGKEVEAASLRREIADLDVRLFPYNVARHQSTTLTLDLDSPLGQEVLRRFPPTPREQWSADVDAAWKRLRDAFLTGIFGIFGRKPKPSDEDLDEWARHHDDPRSDAGFALYRVAMADLTLDYNQLRDMWQQANALVGQRAPADYGEFMAYGYLTGRMDALREDVS